MRLSDREWVLKPTRAGVHTLHLTVAGLLVKITETEAAQLSEDIQKILSEDT